MNTLFLVIMITQMLFGLGFTLMPGPFLAPFGVTFDPTATVFARLYGSALLGFVVILWYARRSDKLEFKKATLYGEFLYLLIGGVVLLITQISGLMNALGWFIIAEHWILTIWSAFFVIKSPRQNP